MYTNVLIIEPGRALNNLKKKYCETLAKIKIECQENSVCTKSVLQTVQIRGGSHEFRVLTNLF